MRFLSTRCHLSREAFRGTPGVLKWSSNICLSLHSSTFPSNHLRVSYYAGSTVLNTTHGTSHLILTEIFNQGIPMYLFQKCGNSRPERLNNMPRSQSSWMSELRLYTGPTLKYMSCCCEYLLSQTSHTHEPSKTFNPREPQHLAQWLKSPHGLYTVQVATEWMRHFSLAFLMFCLLALF